MSNHRFSFVGLLLFTLLLCMFAGSVVAQESETQVVTHELGETAVPVDPQRVVSFINFATDDMLALGVMPIGAVMQDANSFPLHLHDQLVAGAVTGVGTPFEPNLEVVVGLDPDLVIAQTDPTSEVYDELTAIAPTVMISSSVDWRERLRFVGGALNKSVEAEILLAEFDAKLAVVAAHLDTAVGDKTVLMLRSLPTEARVYAGASHSGSIIYDGLGLTRPEAVPADEYSISNISLEVLLEINPDIIFLMLSDFDQTGVVDTWSSDPLWQTLSAVQTGSVYPISLQNWLIDGITASNIIVDDVVDILVK
jgi:iron complex transport system substrate-binding protein